jgi:hypothetical protein
MSAKQLVWPALIIGGIFLATYGNNDEDGEEEWEAGVPGAVRAPAGEGQSSTQPEADPRGVELKKNVVRGKYFSISTYRDTFVRMKPVWRRSFLTAPTIYFLAEKELVRIRQYIGHLESSLKDAEERLKNLSDKGNIEATMRVLTGKVDEILRFYGSTVEGAKVQYLGELVNELQFYRESVNKKLQSSTTLIYVSPQDDKPFKRDEAMALRDSLQDIEDGYGYLYRRVWKCEEFANRLREHYKYIIHPTYMFGLFGGVPSKYKAASTPKRSFMQRTMDYTGLTKPPMPKISEVNAFADQHQFDSLGLKRQKGELPPPTMPKANPVSLFAQSHDDEESESFQNVPSARKSPAKVAANAGDVQRDVQILHEFRKRTEDLFNEIQEFLTSNVRSDRRWNQFGGLLNRFKHLAPAGFLPGTVAGAIDTDGTKMTRIRGSKLKFDNLSEPFQYYKYKYKKLLAVKSTDVLQD